jgi:AcrR family transcriptional regulator
LARQIGVSHDAPRHHFPSKQHLLDALAERGFELLAEEIDDTVRDSRGSFSERLARYVRTYVDFTCRHAELIELMYSVNRERQGTKLPMLCRQAFAPARELIAQAQGSGDLAPGNPDQIYMAMWATMQGLATLINSGWLEDRDQAEVVRATTRVLLKGLRPD